MPGRTCPITKETFVSNFFFLLLSIFSWPSFFFGKGVGGGGGFFCTEKKIKKNKFARAKRHIYIKENKKREKHIQQLLIRTAFCLLLFLFLSCPSCAFSCAHSDSLSFFLLLLTRFFSLSFASRVSFLPAPKDS